MRGKPGMLAAAAVMGVMAWSVWNLPARAIMICDCCARDSGAECAQACANAAKGFCQPEIVMDKSAKGNPLYGANLKYLDLSSLTPAQLEKVRKWAEKARRKAEKDFRMARLMILWGHRDKSTFAEAQARRDAAIVNYQHIMRAYRQAMRGD